MKYIAVLLSALLFLTSCSSCNNGLSPETTVESTESTVSSAETTTHTESGTASLTTAAPTADASSLPESTPSASESTSDSTTGGTSASTSTITGTGTGSGTGSVPSESSTSTSASTTTGSVPSVSESTTAGTAAPIIRLPLSPGTRTWRTDFSVIDYSNLSDGYLTFAYSGNAERLQVIIHTPTSTHAYELPVSDRSVKAFPLTGGNGAYTVEVLEQIPVDGVNRVNTLDRREFNVSLTDPHTPFLMANYFVNYTAGSSVVTTASTITAGLGEVEKIEAVYNWFVNNVSYDFAFAPPRGYVPDLNVLMNTRKGICFDYASGMVAMLRSQGIPARMETGNARLPGGGSEYHAWVSAYTRATGWVNGWIRFNGSEWVLTDPTWASINNQENNVNFRNHVLNRNNYATLELH